jgi:Tfp pilus assembly protein PilX
MITQSPAQRQRGATLVVAMIMLIVLTMFALTAMNASNTNLKIASNTQMRAEVTAAVQQEIDKVVSTNFALNPASVAGSKPVDINNDGTVDYNVVIATPECIASQGVLQKSLDVVNNAADRKCSRGQGQQYSYCYNTRWDVGGNATDPLSGATMTIHQGVSMRVAKSTC